MVYLYHCLRKSHNCDLQNNSYMDTFVCLIVVAWLSVFMFNNPFVKFLGQQIVLLLIEWLFMVSGSGLFLLYAVVSVG